MKLYYSNGSCSLASHIILEEAGAKFDVQRLDLREGEQRRPEYLKVNPKAKVPALELDGGVILTENPAILCYVADTHPGVGLLAAPGTVERAKAQEWLAWCASGVHRDFGPLFVAWRTKIDAEPSVRATVQHDLEMFDRQLAGKRFVLGDRFSVADAYTLVFSYWSKLFGLELGEATRESARGLLDRAGVKRAVATQQLDFSFLR
jgi:glutathione S-transferase